MSELEDIYAGIPKSYPPSLKKACIDEFMYAIKLKNGETIFFKEAEPICDEWVLITPDMINTRFEKSADDFTLVLDRGIEVRVSEILWVADAPLGS